MRLDCFGSCSFAFTTHPALTQPAAEDAEHLLLPASHLGPIYPGESILVTPEPCSLPSLSRLCNAGASRVSVHGKGKGQAQQGGRCLSQKAGLMSLPSLPSTCGAAARAASPSPGPQEQRPQLHLLQLFPPSPALPTSSSSSHLACLPIQPWASVCPSFLGDKINFTHIAA